MKYLFLAVGVIVAIALLLGVEALLALRNKPSPYTNPDPSPTKFGEAGQPLTYVVLGDSTAAGQGADYNQGIAARSGRYLNSLGLEVTMVNLAVSGARTGNVLQEQLPRLVERPDIVLISVGANDVTGLSSVSRVRQDLDSIADELVRRNCDVKILLTAAPDMGTSPRLLQPLRWVAGYRTKQLNEAFFAVIKDRKLTLAPIAQKTGPIFASQPQLFSNDRFHPNEKGYAVWADVINPSLLEAINNQPTHCAR